jgi:hypothetical protein
VKQPKFIERVLDSTTPVLGDVDHSAIVEHLSGASITLRVDNQGFTEIERSGFLLAANLASRLYPAIRLDVSEELATSPGNSHA